jgi:TatD DNase family protein
MDLVLRRKRLLVSSASWTALSNAYLFSPSSHPDSQNLAGIVNINSDPSSYAAGKYLETFSDILFSTWGVHPLRASLYDDALEKTIEANLRMPKAVAVGECGLDYVKLDAANIGPAKFIQKMVFSRHLYLAKKTGKAIIVHMRGAENDTFDLLKDTLPEDHRIQMQCYTGTTELAKLVMDQFPNAVFGVAGLATYAGAAEKRDDIVNFLPLDRIVFESVAPRGCFRQRSLFAGRLHTYLSSLSLSLTHTHSHTYTYMLSLSMTKTFHRSLSAAKSGILD